VAIARALANNPPLLLADEPTGNLNSEAGALVLDTLQQVRADFGTTVVIVTHDAQVAGQADRVLRLVDGRIVEAYVP
jgi:putative ABC transport system ATP-binding protein